MDAERPDDSELAGERPYDPSPEAEAGHPPRGERGAEDDAPAVGAGDAPPTTDGADAPAPDAADGADARDGRDAPDAPEDPSDPAVIQADPSTAGGPSGGLPDGVERLRGG